MEWYWEFLELSANLVEAIMLVVFLQFFFEPRYKTSWPQIISVAGVFALITANNNLNVSMEASILLYVGIGMVLGFLIHRGSIISRILLPLLMMALILVSEVMAMGVLLLAYGNNGNDFQQATSYRMLGIIISKVLLIVLVYTTGRFSRKTQSKIPISYSLSLLLFPAISIISMITIGQYVLNSAESMLSPFWFAISAFGLMLLNLLIIYLFDAFMRYTSAQSTYQLMIQQAEMLNNHLRETNALQEETHRVWHDMKNHFTVIQWMVKSKSYEKLEQYLLNLNDTVTDSMLKIQSGNSILDALLNPKAAEAKKYNIEMTVNACVPSSISIEDIDLNIVFSNALDNAMDACKKMPDGKERFITIDSYVRNDHLVFLIKNSFNGIVKISGDELKTTKLEPGRHGIGMGNMKRVTDKYDGHIMTNIEGNIFILSIMMNCQIIGEKAV